jgi:hypothetical protein
MDTDLNDTTTDMDITSAAMGFLGGMEPRVGIRAWPDAQTLKGSALSGRLATILADEVCASRRRLPCRACPAYPEHIG